MKWVLEQLSIIIVVVIAIVSIISSSNSNIIYILPGAN